MFDSRGGGLGRVVAAFADLTGCDRAALAALVEQRPDVQPHTFDAAAVLARIGASERLSQAAQAVQVEELAGFNAGYLAGGADVGFGTERDGDVPCTSRLAGIEVAEQLRVAPITASLKIADAVAAVHSHRPVLDLVGTGAVSMAGLGRVLDATGVLDPHRQQQVAAALAAEACRRELTPGQLGKAAERRVLQADPDAVKRVAAARRDRSVRLGDPVDGVAGLYATLRAEEAVAIWAGLDATARGLRGHGDPRSLDTLRADLFVASLSGRTLTRLPTPIDNPASPAPDESAAPSGLTEQPADLPLVWRRTRGAEPAFNAIPPPLLADPDPEPDDPVWDSYLNDAAAADPADPDPPDPDAPEPVPPDRRAGLDVEVQVVVSLSTVLGLDREPGLLRGYGAIPAETVAEIVATAEVTGSRTWLRTLFCDPIDGRLVAMTSRSERFVDELRRFGMFRDQVDRLTGGPIRDQDHIDPKAKGGKTTAANEQGLGPFTNRVVKEHPDVHVRALAVEPHGDGLDGYRRHAPDIEWTLPSGQRHLSHPPPVLGYGSDPHDVPAPADTTAETTTGCRVDDCFELASVLGLEFCALLEAAGHVDGYARYQSSSPSSSPSPSPSSSSSSLSSWSPSSSSPWWRPWSS